MPGGRGQPLTVHGWIYALRDGLLRDLHFTSVAADGVDPAYQRALARVAPAVWRWS